MLGGLAEFSTAVRHQVDLIVVVCNDGCYGAEYRKLTARDFGTEHSLFDWPDFAPVADALGGVGCTVRSLDDLSCVEKVVTGGGSISVRVRALPPGRYRFFDDYHEATTVGFLVVK